MMSLFISIDFVLEVVKQVSILSSWDAIDTLLALHGSVGIGVIGRCFMGRRNGSGGMYIEGIALAF
jgi:hypothetical protein